MPPETWEPYNLGEVAEFINGRGFKPYEWAESGLPIIRIQNLNGSEQFNFYQGTYDPKIEVHHGERLRLNFDPAEFMKQKILLPECMKEQSKIADLLDRLVREIRTLEKELDALKMQKKGLIQKLLTGQIRVKL